MDTLIYLFRHGITESNKKGVWQLSIDEEISPEGASMVEAVSGIVSDLNPDIVVCSPMRRTMETARILVKHLGNVELVKCPDLVERTGGVIEGLTSQEIQSRYGVSFRTIMDSSIDGLPGVESVADFVRRIGEAISKIYNEYSEKRILAVTHGGVMRAFYSNYVINNEKRRLFHNCSIMGVKRIADGWEMFYTTGTDPD